MFCKQCGNEIADAAVICIKCGVAADKRSISAAGDKSRTAYILLGLFLGCFGVHNFYSGYTGKGVAQLLLTFVGLFFIFPLIAVVIWVIVEICTVTQDSEGNKFS